MRRTTLIATPLLAALAVPVAADAASMRTARFTATVEAKQVTTWNVPRHDTYRDCQGQRWQEGKGEETLRFRTKPTKVLVFKPPYATGAQVAYGTWSTTKEPPLRGLDGTGTLTRVGAWTRGIVPGECFDAGDPTTEPAGVTDCGRRTWEPEVLLQLRKGRLDVEATTMVIPLDGTGGRYRSCPVEAPEGVETADWTVIGQRYPLRDVFDRSQGLVEVLGRRTWTGEVAGGKGTATTTTTFKVRLRRAR